MIKKLAIEGGVPVRERLLPYGRQLIEQSDIDAVERVLRSDWLTTGPAVDEFERQFAGKVGTVAAVALSNGTAALHAIMHALRLEKGDEVVVPCLTFAATANAVRYVGATPRFADVAAGTLLIDESTVLGALTDRTRAIVAVDYAGQPADYTALRRIAEEYGLALIADGCHALGAYDNGRPVGSVADMTAFSLHPVKHITAGEGGVVSTDNAEMAARVRRFRSHGITTDHRQREQQGSWFYEMVELGYNYRLTDIQCALASSQLERLGGWIDRRRAIADRYARSLPAVGLEPLDVRAGVQHAYHLYVVRLRADAWRVGRDDVYAALRAEGIGVNVHYVPVHLHPYYRATMGTGPGLCPVGEAAYDSILSVPMFAGMTEGDVDDVISACEKVFEALRA